MTRMASVTLFKPPKTEKAGKGTSLSLEKVIQECTKTKVSWGLMQNDIAFALAFWSMIECGFKSVGQEEAKSARDKNENALPKDWKHNTRQVYEAHFVLPPHLDCPVKLVALPAGDILCLNVLASNVSPKNINLKSLAIHSPGYVPRPEEETTFRKFSDLNDFQFLLRNVIIWPIRCSILTDQGIMNGSLCGVSDEIKFKIVRHLSVSDVLMLSLTCHDLNRICNDQELWKSFYHDVFKCECDSNPKKCEKTQDWKERFKHAFTQMKKDKNLERSSSTSYVTAHEGFYGSDIDFDID